MSSLELSGGAVTVSDPDKWGASSPALLRVVAVVSWAALFVRLVAAALPGSRSGIATWIVRSDLASSLLTQSAALLGSALLVLLAIGTLAERGLPYMYRIALIPTSVVVVMLVMLAATTGLEPAGSLALGSACLLLSASGAGAALRVPSTRATGMVLTLVILGATGQLAVRFLSMDASHRDPAWITRASWLATTGHAFDAFGIALAAARLRAEQRGRAALALVVVIALAILLSWGAMRGSLDGAPLWQVLADRAMSELTTSPIAFSTLASRTSVDVLAVLLAGVIVAWPGRISVGAMCAALALTARAGVDVPEAALVLSLGALAAPLGGMPISESTASRRATHAAEPERSGSAGRA